MKFLPDYDVEDGWDEERGLQMCPECGRRYSGNGLYWGPVYDTDGDRYDSYLDPEWQDGPFLCADCFTRFRTEYRRETNETLRRYI